jgi:CRISPR type I-D-associated protein Csc2
MGWIEEISSLGLSEYLVEEIPLLRSTKTIQLLVMRQTHDYTIFRTEETRELNTATLPRSIDDPEPVIKVVFLAGKQKAPENRKYISLFRTVAGDRGLDIGSAQNCRLKDKLCRSCPRCVLFGAVVTEEGTSAKKRWNIKHRIEYSSSFSIEPYDEVSEMITFNAVDPATQSTGQALGFTENIEPVVNFPSVVTLNSVTEEELIWYLKTLLATKSYGAETRVKGDVVNEVIGIIAGYEEVITSLEFNLEICSNGINNLETSLNKYKELAAFPDKVLILGPETASKLVNAVRRFQPDRDFLGALRDKAMRFSEKASQEAS